MADFVTADDELFLFETYSDLIKQTKDSPTPDCSFPYKEDDADDIPLSDYLFFEKDECECESPLDIKLGFPEVFFPPDFTEGSCPSSPCESPASLFPFEYEWTPPPSLSPSLSPTSPTVTSPFAPTSLLSLSPAPVQMPPPPPPPRLETPPPHEELPLNWFEPQMLSPKKQKPQLQQCMMPSFPTDMCPLPISQPSSIHGRRLSHAQKLQSSSNTIQTSAETPLALSPPRLTPTQTQICPTETGLIPTQERPNRPTPIQSRTRPTQMRPTATQTRTSLIQVHHPDTMPPKRKRHGKEHVSACSLHMRQRHRAPTNMDADLATVHFIDLKDTYEKTQVRRGGISEQRLVDCRVHLMAVFTTTPKEFNVYVHRFHESSNVEDQIEIPVTYEITLKNTQYFSVNLDAVYLTSFGNRFYQLSTTDRMRKNRFVLKCILTFKDGSSAAFTSEPFLLRSRKQSPNPRKQRNCSHNSI